MQPSTKTGQKLRQRCPSGPVFIEIIVMTSPCNLADFSHGIIEMFLLVSCLWRQRTAKACEALSKHWTVLFLNLSELYFISLILKMALKSIPLLP